MTLEQAEIRDAAVLIILQDGSEEGQLARREAVLASYIQAMVRECPDLTKDEVKINALNYWHAIQARLREIALLQRVPEGNA